jgi:hypothetical protein
MNTKKLLNKGQRSIEFKGGVLHPNKVGEIEFDQAVYLKGLFPFELQDLDDAIEDFTSKPVEKFDAVVEEKQKDKVVSEEEKKSGIFGFGK